MTRSLWLFPMAFALVWCLTPFAGFLSRRYGVLDRPNARKIHSVPTPKAGGVAIVLGFVLSGSAAALVEGIASPAVFLLLGLTLLVGAIGWADDKWDLSAWSKLAALALPSAIWSVYVHGLTSTGVFKALFEMVFLLASMNAVNLIDGLDGLAAGVGSITAICLAVIGVMQHDFGLFILATALAGATAGFLPHNFHPARIFMGDTGSLVVGFGLGVLSLWATKGIVLSVNLPVALGVLALPFFDTLVAVIRRKLHHRSVFAADKSHTYNLLMLAGTSHRNAVLWCYGLSGVLGALACVYSAFPSVYVRLGLLVVGVGLLAAMATLFDFWQVDEPPAQRSSDAR